MILSQELFVAAPEIWVMFMALACLVIPSHSFVSAQITLWGALIISLSQVHMPSAVIFDGLYIADNMSTFLKIFIEISALATLYYGRSYIKHHAFPKLEYYWLGLLSVLGMMVLCSSNSCLALYMGLEVLALPIYTMIALRRNEEKALEASIKYFVMGAVASAMLLYGMSLLYGATGSLEFSVIASKTQSLLSSGNLGSNMLLSFALVFIIAGIGFKLASVPFHMWAPDVYAGSPLPVTLFLSTAPKIAAIGMTIRLLVFALPGLHAQWQPFLMLLAVLSIGAGNLLAIVQTNIRRLLAYSSIGHLGYALLGLISGTHGGYSASLFYIAMYSLMGLGSFGILLLMSREGIEITNIEDLKGLNERSPWLAFLMLLIFFSLAGVPPFVGFFAKFFVLRSLLDANLIGLLVFGLAMAVVGAFYYIRVVKVMYFDTASLDSGKVKLSGLACGLISVNALALLAFGLFPTALFTYCQTAFH